MIALNLFGGHLYLKAMKMSKAYVESLYELGYLTVGTTAIYIVSLIQFISLFGVMIIYFVVFGDICGSITK